MRTNSTFNTGLVQNVTLYNPSELVTIDWPHMSSCYFDLRPNKTAGNGANGSTFVINSTARATPITIGHHFPFSTSTSTPAPTTLSASSDALPKKSGGSNGKAIGVGVAVGLAVVIATGLGIFFFCRRRKAQQGSMIPDRDSDVHKWHQGGQHNGSYVYMQPMSGKKQASQELASKVPTHELPAGDGRSNEVHEMGVETSV